MAGKPLYFSSLMKMVPVKEGAPEGAVQDAGASEKRKKAANR